MVGGRKFFLRGIRYSGVPLKTLRDAGFNTVWLDEAADAETVAQAVNLGFWLVPSLAVENRPASPRGQAPGLPAQLVGRRMAHFLQMDAVLGWDFGGGLAAEQYVSVQHTATAVRSVDPSPPLPAVDVWDGFQSYSRGIDQVMLGVHRWPLMTGLELTQYHRWLTQHRQLASRALSPGRGCRRICPTGSRTSSMRSRARLASTSRSARSRSRFACWRTQRRRPAAAASVSGRTASLPTVTPATIACCKWPCSTSSSSCSSRCWSAPRRPVGGHVATAGAGRGNAHRLRRPVPADLGRAGSQFVPGQSAVANLTLTVPQVPTGTQAWLISPGEIRALRSERIVGGTRITLPEFGLTAAVVFTSDLVGRNSLVAHLQDQVRSMSKIATQWSYDLAQEELAKVVRINTELEEEGHRLPDGQKLLEDTRRRLQLCATHRRNGNTVEAYGEAQWALRPLRRS